MSTQLRVEGFPPASNKVKVDLFLAKSAKECSVAPTEVKNYHTFVDLQFANNEDTETYMRNLPSFSFGGQLHILKASIIPRPKENNWMNPDLATSADSFTSPQKPEEEFHDCLPSHDEELEELSPPEVDFLKAYSWFDLSEFLLEYGSRAILVQSHDACIGPDQLIEHFQCRKASNGGPIKTMLLMIDGILIIFHKPNVTKQVLCNTLHNIDGHRVKVFSKDIPELHKDRLVLKTESNDLLPEDEMKMDIANLSPYSTSPDKISESEIKNAFLVTYDEPLGEEDFQGLIQKAKEREFDETSKVHPLPRTDCIAVEGMPQDVDTKRLKIRMENRAFSDGAIITRISRLKNGLVLVYFASFKHADEILKKYGETGIDLFNGHLTVKPYFHCFSNSHTEAETEHLLDEYSKAMFEKAVAPLSFEYADTAEEILTFVNSRRTHVQKLRNALVEIAKVEIVTKSTQSCLKVTPISVEVAKDQETFKKLCAPILERFFAQYSSKTHGNFDLENLKKVRYASVDQKLNASGMDDVECDYNIRWNGSEKQVVVITGVASEVDSTMKNIVSLVDIGNQTLNITKGKYEWLMKSGEYSRLAAANPCSIKRDDSSHLVTFSGSKNRISQAHLEFLKVVEPVKDEKFDSLDEHQARFLTNTRLITRILSRINSSIEHFKATFTIENGIPRIWCPEENVNKTVIAIRKILTTDKTIVLTPAEKNATKPSDWDRKCTSLQDQHLVEIKIQNLNVVLVGFHKEINTVKQKIKAFLGEFTVQTSIFKIGYGKAQYILKFFAENFKKSPETKDIDCGIASNPFRGLFLKGRKNPVEKANAALSKLEIFEDIHTFKQFGIYEYFTMGKGKDEIDGITGKCLVLIGGTFPTEIAEASKEVDLPAAVQARARDGLFVDSAESDEYDSDLADCGSDWADCDSDLSTAPFSRIPRNIADEFALFFRKEAPQKLVCSVYKGDILKSRNDAIVNCMGDSFSLKNGGLVCKAILQKGGSKIQFELDKLNGSHVRVTSGGNLLCKNIVHAIFSNQSSTIKKRLEEVLRVVDDKKLQSLAIPAIGTGSSNMPAAEVAGVIFDAINGFTDAKFLKKVDIVIFDDKILPIFEKALKSTRDEQLDRLDALTSLPPPSQEQANPLSASGASAGLSAQQPPSSVSMGHFTVAVKKGDITDEKTDGIVNSIGNNFNLSQGLVSRQILKKGGDGIQKELEKISGSALRVTSGGKLPTKKIIHVVFPNTEEKMKASIHNIIERADEEKCTTLSIPALGTGQLNLPSRAIAKLMCETFADFVSKNPQTKHLKKIDIVVFDEPKFPDFVAELITPQTAAAASPAGQRQKAVFAEDIISERLRSFHNGIQSDLKPSRKSEVNLTNTIPIGSLKLTVRKGDITEEKSDAIVNSTGSSFDLSQGQISRHIISKGGKVIQNELRKEKDSDIRVTSGGALSCRKIIHVVFPNAPDKMKECLKKILARADKESFTSVSFPAIGTGNMNLACGQVAKCIREALNEYISGSSGIKNLQHVYIVIYEEGKFSDFLKELVTIPLSQRSGAIPKTSRTDSKQLHRSEDINRFRKVEKESYPRSSGVISSDFSSLMKYQPADSNFLQIGSLAVTVRKGDITEEKYDAIVNSTGKDFDLSRGMVSNQIVKKGGDKIQKELSSAVGVDIRVTSGGKLPCGKIIHVVSPDTKSKMKQCVKTLLMRADDEKCRSISIPAIGTGNLKMASCAIAQDIRRAVEEYVSQNPNRRHLRIIDIVIYDENKFDDFLKGFIASPVDSPTTNSRPPRSRTSWPKDEDMDSHSKKQEDPDAITLFFYGQKKKKISSTVKTIQNHIQLVFDKKTSEFNDFDDLIIWESKSLEQILRTHKVGSSLDKSGKKIVLSGKKDDIAATEREIVQLVAELSGVKKHQSLALYQWKYCAQQNQWDSFDPLSNKAAEECYHESKKGEVKIWVDGKRVDCILDPEAMKVSPKRFDKPFEYAVRRGVKKEFPRAWAAMGESENYAQVKLDSSSDEYSRVKNKLTASVPNCTIDSICRIQNKKLYLRYQEEKKRVRGISSATEIERELFHGTSGNMGDRIAAAGFDRGFAGDSNAAAYGRGAYFASNGSYSNQQKYASPNRQGVKTMLLANVITGDYCKGASSMKAPPDNPNTKEPFNCAVDCMNEPTIFVIFVDFGVYPAYMIKYKV